MAKCKYANEKSKQLGMNASTASGRLVKDVLFKLVAETGKNVCFQCGGMIERDQFSIEHKTPWLHAENAKELFFDLNNIAFSHLSCNLAAARKPQKKYETPEEARRGLQNLQNLRRRGSDSKYNVMRRKQRKKSPQSIESDVPDL